MVLSARNHWRGVTLIEILIVSAVVGILAVLLFPVVGKAREIAGKSGCVNNLRQWGAAISLYAADNDMLLPTHQMSSNPGVPGGREIGWDERLSHYVPFNYANLLKEDLVARRRSILVCPAEKVVAEPGDYTYAYNIDLNYRLQGVKALVKLSGLENASRYVLMTDSYKSMSLSTATAGRLKDAIKPERRHQGTPNFLYADGHVAPFVEELVGYNEVTGQNKDFYYNLWFAEGTPPHLR